MTTRDPRAARLARFAGLVADETRAVCLLALLDGRAWTAGELARHARVAPSTLSGHLDRLVTGGLLAEERQGRHRYVRLADARAAQLVEELAAGTGGSDLPARAGLRAATADSAMARARTCYDHLAGRLGVAVTDALAERGLLLRETGFALTDAGLRWFAATGIPPTARAAAPWPAPASTGRNGARTSRAPPGPRCAGTPWRRAGARGSARSGPYG